MNTHSAMLFWKKNENLIINNGIICARRKEDFSDYDPTKYFLSPIDYDVASNILGPSINKQTIYYLLTLFISLDVNDENQLLSWVKNFGFPYDTSLTCDISEHEEYMLDEELRKYQDYLPGEYFDENSNKNSPTALYSIQELREDILSLRLTTLSLNVVKENNQVNMDTIFKDLIENNVYLNDSKISDFYYFIDWDDLISPDILSDDFHNITYKKDLLKKSYNNAKVDFFKSLVEFMFSENIRIISPSFKYREKDLSMFYYFDSLLNLMYYMLANYSFMDRLPIKCQSRTCNNYFLPSRKGQISCSEICKNRAKQQRLRDKKKSHTQDVIK